MFEAEVLLLDEPLGALDLNLRRQMQLELKRIRTEVGITFIQVTHDQEEAMTMVDTIAVLNQGKVEQLGAPVDLYENPRTAFLAGSLGQTNLLSVNVISHGNDVVKVDFHGVTLALPAARMAASGTAVEAGVRPGKIQLADRGQAPQGMNAIDGTIIDTYFIGVSTQNLVRADADDGFVVSLFRSIKLLSVTHLVGLTSDGRVLAARLAVILGLTYNFLPFMPCRSTPPWKAGPLFDPSGR